MKFHTDPATDGLLKSLLLAVELSSLDGDSTMMSLAADPELAAALGWGVEAVAEGLQLLERAGAVWVLEAAQTGWDDRVIFLTDHPHWLPVLATWPASSPEAKAAVLGAVLEHRRAALGGG